MTPLTIETDLIKEADYSLEDLDNSIALSIPKSAKSASTASANYSANRYELPLTSAPNNETDDTIAIPVSGHIWLKLSTPQEKKFLI